MVLMQSGYSFQMCMQYLKTTENQDVFERMHFHLKNGDPYENWLPDCFYPKIANHLKSFMKFLRVQDALSLSIQIYQQQIESYQQLLKMAVFPMMMFCVCLLSVQLFCAFCMPVLISMMKGFQVSTLGIEIMFHVLMTISAVLLLLMIITGIGIVWFTRKKRIVLAVVFLYQMKFGKLVEKELSLDFARMMFQCIRLGIPTKKALEMLKQCTHQPLIVFLSWHVEQVLIKGGNLEEALSIRYLDPALQRIMKTAVLSGNVLELLEGYLIVSQQKRKKRLELTAKVIQTTSYVLIAMMIVLVYQVLFLPLSMLEGM